MEKRNQDHTFFEHQGFFYNDEIIFTMAFLFLLIAKHVPKKKWDVPPKKQWSRKQLFCLIWQLLFLWLVPTLWVKMSHKFNCGGRTTVGKGRGPDGWLFLHPAVLCFPKALPGLDSLAKQWVKCWLFPSERELLCHQEMLSSWLVPVLWCSLDKLWKLTLGKKTLRHICKVHTVMSFNVQMKEPITKNNVSFRGWWWKS